MKARRTLASSAVHCLVLSAAALSRVTTGLPPFGSFGGGPIDTVNKKKLRYVFFPLALGAFALQGQSVSNPSASDHTPPITINRDSQALAVISQAQTALAGTSGTVSDVTIEAQVHWIKGSEDETVSATFASAGPGTSKSSFNLSGGTRVELRSQLTGTSVNAGQAQDLPLHNVLNMHEWFFPQFFLRDLQEQTGYSLSAPAAQTVDGKTQIAIEGSLIPKGQMDTATAQGLSRATHFQLVLDGDTYQPVSLSFVQHPDDDSVSGAPVVYQFSDYQLQQGIHQPLRIQKYVQGTLTQDITIRSLVLNSGLILADFQMAQ